MDHRFVDFSLAIRICPKLSRMRLLLVNDRISSLGAC